MYSSCYVHIVNTVHLQCTLYCTVYANSKYETRRMTPRYMCFITNVVNGHSDLYQLRKLNKHFTFKTKFVKYSKTSQVEHFSNLNTHLT